MFAFSLILFEFYFNFAYKIVKCNAIKLIK